MNRLFRIASTILVVVGMIFIFFYIFSKKITAGIGILERPSYYVSQNFWMVFLAGAAVVLFAIIGSFFSWHVKSEPQEEILLNAGYTDKKQIEDWVDGSTLDSDATSANSVVGARVATVAMPKPQIAETEIIEEEV